MRRFRIRRRRALAAALLAPAAALTTLFAVNTGLTPLTAAHAETSTTERQAAFETGRKAVRFGRGVALRGSFSNAPRRRVAIEYSAAGRSGFRRVQTTRTNDRSRWSVRVRPRRTGAWRARLLPLAREAEDGEASLTGTETDATTAGATSSAARVRVRSKTRVKAKQRHTPVGGRVRIKGRVKPGGKRRVTVRVGGKRIRTRSNRRGRFSVRWRPRSTGTYRVKARAHGNKAASGSRDRGGRVTAYRRAHASWYGPGLYGNRTACGQTLTPSTVGVAHKTMPCGTKLKLRYRGRTVKVRVIDRGPYVAGREFDLTEATRNRLGFGSIGTVLSSK